jgi:hypothetical protein
MNIKFISIFFVCFFLISCTVYTEKQTEALSRSVYATKDSIDKARIDLANVYSNETVRLVKPPKKRIEIESIYKTTQIPVVTSEAKPDKPIPNNKQRVLMVPEQYKNDTVVVVNSQEYEQLLKDKQIFQQLKKDLDNAFLFKIEIDEELTKQQEYSNKLIRDLNTMQKQLVEKDLAILKRNIVIAILLLMGVGATYLRIKGIL